MQALAARIGRSFKALGVSDLLVAQIYPILASVAVTFVTARLLGPSGRGTLAYVTAACTLGGAVLFFSLHVGAADLQHRNGPGLQAAAAACATIVGAVLIAAAAVTLLGIMPASTFGLVCGASLVAVNLVILRTTQALGSNRTFRRSWAIQSIGYAALAIPAAWVTGSYKVVVACWALTIGLSTSYSALVFNQLRNSVPLGRKHVLAAFRTSAAAHAGSLGLQVLYRSDLVVLGLVATAAEVGYYSIAVTAIGFIWNIAEAFSLRSFQTNQNETEIVRHARDIRLLKMNLVLSAAVAIAICAAAAVMIPLLLPGFRQSISLILILSIGVTAQAPARIAFASLQRQGRLAAVLAIGLCAVVLSVAYIPIARFFGAPGLAWASTISYVALAVGTLLVWTDSSKRRNSRRQFTEGWYEDVD